jgi:hypothetical protein
MCLFKFSVRRYSSGVSIPPRGFLLLCGAKDFKFGIGGDDTVTLLDHTGGGCIHVECS